MRPIVFFVSFFLAASLTQAHESPASASGSSSHAPISVMGDHTHKAGEWMVSYRYMRMAMDGNLDGSDHVSSRDITGTMANPGDYMVAPLTMDMDMHMRMCMSMDMYMNTDMQ